MKEPPHILIVDDEPNIRLVFRTALESTGCRLSTAKDGEEALLWLQGSMPDLVLLDLMMPGIGGMDVLEAIRESGNGVPVVIITAKGSIPDAVHAMKLGAIDFLAKPLAPAVLRSIVADVLARHAGPAPELPRTEPVTAASQFAANLSRAKRALNRRVFDEAEVFLRQAIALDPNSAEVHNLMGVLFEPREEHNSSYREYRAALKADRQFEPARKNIRRFYERFTSGFTAEPIDMGELGNPSQEDVGSLRLHPNRTTNTGVE